MSISAQAFTDIGRTMLGRANNGELLTFDTMVIGAGVAASTPALYPLVALIDHRFNVAITAQVDQGNGILVLDGVINSADIPAGQGFNLCELGLMAHIAAEAPALYSVANVLATTPDYIPDAVENPTAVHAFKIKVVIDRAPNVTVVLGTSIDIIAENMGPATDPNGVYWPGVFHEKIANTLRFKRLAPGDGIELTEDPLDPFTITIAQKILKVDLDLYVPETHPLAPDPSVAFPTIQDALDSLDATTIPPDRTATIHVQRGDYPITSPITVTHPQSNRIQIIGEVETVRNLVSVSPATGGVGAYYIPITLDSAANIAVNDLVAIYDATGTWPGYAQMLGLLLVTAVAGNTITILLPLPFALTTIGMTTASVLPFKTFIRPAAGISALDIYGSGLLLAQNLGFVSDQTGTPFAIRCRPKTAVNLNTIGMLSFNGQGLLVDRGSEAYADTIFGSLGNHLVFCAGYLKITDEAIFTFATAGLFLTSGKADINNARFIGNGYGISAVYDAVVSFTGNNWLYHSSSAGMYIIDGSTVIGTGAATVDFRTGNLEDLFLSVLSSFNMAAGSISYWATANIAAGFSNATGCYLVPSTLLRDRLPR